MTKKSPSQKNANLHLPWLLPTTDKGLYCPLIYFLKNLSLSLVNSIVPLFSSDIVIKFAFTDG